MLAIPSVWANKKNDTFVLVLDPGHGGRDAGAVGKNTKSKEKNINLSVALLAGEYISKKHPDVKIVYTRKNDVFVPLINRANIANKNKANLFISIHTNSATKREAKGPEVFTLGMSRSQENFEIAKKENEVILLEDNYEETYQGFDPSSIESYIIFEFIQSKHAEQSIGFASLVQDELKKCVSWRDRGVKQAGYLVLAKTTSPCILVELDFISNSEAERFLITSKAHQRYAKAISDAFTKYKDDYDRKKGIASHKNNTIPEKEKPTSKKEETGKIYKVQILSSSKELPSNSRELKGYQAQYYKENNLYKYTYGESNTLGEILKTRKSLLKDFKDAFIICFENGIKVPAN